jgi:hypothetical protein
LRDRLGNRSDPSDVTQLLRAEPGLPQQLGVRLDAERTLADDRRGEREQLEGRAPMQTGVELMLWIGES